MKSLRNLWDTHGKRIRNRLASGLSDLKKVAIGASKEGIFTNRSSQEKIQKAAEKAKRRNPALSDEEANKVGKEKLNRERLIAVAEAAGDAFRPGANTTQIIDEVLGEMSATKVPMTEQVINRVEKATQNSSGVIDSTVSDVRIIVEDLAKKAVDSVFGTRQSAQESQSPSTDVSSTETDEQSETTKKKKTDGSVIGSMKRIYSKYPDKDAKNMLIVSRKAQKK